MVNEHVQALTKEKEMRNSLMDCSQSHDQKKSEHNRNNLLASRDRLVTKLEALGQPVNKKFKSYMPLIADREQILNAIVHEPYVKRPYPILQGSSIDKTKYCSFHMNYGHTTK